MLARIDIRPEQVQAAKRAPFRAGRDAETEGEAGRRGAPSLLDDGPLEGRKARQIVRDAVAATVAVAAAMIRSPSSTHARAHEIGALQKAAGAVHELAGRPSRLVAQNGSGRLGPVRRDEAPTVVVPSVAYGPLQGSRAVPATRVLKGRQVECALTIILVRARTAPDRRARSVAPPVGRDSGAERRDLPRPDVARPVGSRRGKTDESWWPKRRVVGDSNGINYHFIRVGAYQNPSNTQRIACAIRSRYFHNARASREPTERYRCRDPCHCRTSRPVCRHHLWRPLLRRDCHRRSSPRWSELKW